MGLPIEVELAVKALGGTELGTSGEYRLERGEARIYVIPRAIAHRTWVDLALLVRPDPGRARLTAPPECELADASSSDSNVLGDTSYDLQTGDARFDERVFVDLAHRDEEAAMLEILGSPAVREIVLDFVDSGARVRLDPGPKAWLTARFEQSKRLEDRSELERLALRLVELERLIPRFSSSGAARPKPGCGCVAAVALLAVASIFIANLTDLAFGSIGSGLELRALISSPLLYALILLAGWLALRKTTRSRKPLLGIGIVSLIAAPVTSVVSARVLNAAGDSSVRAEHVTVLDKGVLHFTRRGRDVHWLDVSPWGTHTAPVRLDIDPELHDRIAKGDAIAVHVGRGRLGFEWISDIVHSSPR